MNYKVYLKQRRTEEIKRENELKSLVEKMRLEKKARSFHRPDNWSGSEKGLSYSPFAGLSL